MTEKFKIKIAASAESDLATIWDYISQSNPENAIAFIAEIEKKMRSLVQFPERNPFIPEGEFLGIEEYRHSLYKNYRIIYRIQGGVVHIARIYHGSRLLDSNSLF